KSVDTRSDIYSVGVILFEFLTGHRPFQGPLLQVMHDHAYTPPPRFQDKAPGHRVPAEVERVVMQCLEKDPALRPASARALAESFLKASGRSIKPRVVPASRPRVRVAAAVAGLVLVAVVGTLTLVFTLRSLVGVPVTGTISLEFDAPVDGLV